MPKTLNFQKIFITGGAGFIGSHLVDRLCKEEKEVVVFDNLSSGKLENIKQWLKKSNFKFVREDLLKPAGILKPLSECETIFHLAANPEVRVGTADPKVHYEQNIVATFNLLEVVRKVGCVKNFIFASSSTVYGDAEKIPTPEDYAPLKPISIYGASKLASEALITAYAYTYGFDAIIYRLANIIGPRSQHGVIYDFVNKLSMDSKKLEILGDGTQRKSYLYIDDCIDAILTGVNHSHNRVEIYNVGSEDQVNVKEIADIVSQEMGLKDVKYVYTGGVDGGRGWKGDVKVMLLSIEKIKSLGWKLKLNSHQAVRKTVKAILRERKSSS
ncbi:MAG: NAD-dependent epimerase/dehydratase family protein [Candidatus Bathyarchaeota archaeon]|jgi:UDP-glucose 4-epimerase|nr:NAD-dependent epimerase/dehydratase family protein [Candidatus Bathyarchaeota archaeon]